MRFVVIGGGIAGLIAASTLRHQYPTCDISLLERNSMLGGLLSGTVYPQNNLYFDIGTHIFQETGIKELDSMLLGAVPKSNLLYYPLGQGDTAGLVFGSYLQAHSHFPDLRKGAISHQLELSLREHINKRSILPAVQPLEPLLSVSTQRFGSNFCDSLIAPSLSRTFCCPPESLAGFALLLSGWTRVIIDDYPIWENRIDDDRYRSLVAVPDQSKLPLKLHHGRHSFYSRKLGTRSFINGLSERLINNGVQIFCGTKILKLHQDFHRISAIDQYGEQRSFIADGVVIATGAVGAARLLGLDLNPYTFDPPLAHWIINVELDQPTLSNLCYVNAFDETCDWYRLTNYRAFSGNPEDKRLTIEVLGSKPKTLEVLLKQLKDIDFLRDTCYRFSDRFELTTGFPSPTVRNLTAISSLGLSIVDSLPDHVILAGVGSHGGVFFQNDVISSAYKSILEFSNKF